MSASIKKKLRKEQAAEMMTERQRQEQAEAKQVKTMTVVFCVIMIAIVAAFLITNVVNGIDRSGIIEKNTIVATVGENKLNSVTMNYYFYDAVNNFYSNASNSYGEYANSYLLSMGIDMSKPLDEQVYDNESGMTWADYFLDTAIDNAKSDYALYDLAKADSFQLDEDAKANISNELMYMNLYAQFSGAADTDAYLRMMYGNGSTEKNFEEYLTVSATASAYYNAKLESLEYDDAAIREYEKDRYNEFSSYTFNSYYVPYTDYLTGGTKGEDGNTTYSEDEKEAARQEAQKVALGLADCKTVEELDAAIAALPVNKDKETKPTSTANTDKIYTELKEEYATWLSEDGHKAGDTKLFPNSTTTTDDNGNEVETINGYYVLMFQAENENLEKLDNVRHILISFEGGTTDDEGNTTYSDEEKNAAKTKAEDLLKKWKDGEATEESFAALVAENTADDGSSESGGLYEEIHRKSNYVENFLNFAIDANRKVGDTDIVESDYGYHVMYYVGEDELTYRDYLIREEMTSNDISDWYEGVIEAVTVVEGDSSKINKDLVYQAA